MFNHSEIAMTKPTRLPSLATEERRFASQGTVRRTAVTLLVGLFAVVPLTVAQADDGHVHSIAGHCDTTFNFTGPTTVHLTGNCVIHGIGSVTADAVQTVTPRDDGTLFITNATTYTTHNGDKLFGNFVGVGVFVDSAHATFSGTESYRRGTGKFADAVGSVALAGSATFTSPSGGVGEFDTIGTIAF